jgi:ABC-type antimicrobial peptide transport system permease subunit
VFVIFGALSFAVSAIGLAVIAAYDITRRTHEIGIRAALGAAPAGLVRLILHRRVAVVVVGLAVGLGLTWVGSRLLNAQLFDVTTGDPRVLVSTTLTLLAVGSLAAWLPARRAARIDPVIALRSE